MKDAGRWTTALVIGALALLALPAAASAATAGPNGLIAFGSNHEGDYDIYVQAQDGSPPVNLTTNRPADDYDPAWSPDGTRIIFTSTSAGGELIAMNADGSGQAPIPITGPNDRLNAVFSPDGTK